MPKIVDHKAFKIELLEKSITVFSKHGYSELTMRQLAEKLNISTGTLYHYFESKEVLFRELFRYLGKKTLEEVVDDLCGLSTTEEKVSRLIDFFENRCARMQSQFLLSADLIRNDIGEASEEILYEWASYLRRSLKLLIGLPEDISEVIYTYLSGALYTSFLHPSDKPVHAKFKIFREMVFFYLAQNKIKGNNREITKKE